MKLRRSYLVELERGKAFDAKLCHQWLQGLRGGIKFEELHVAMLVNKLVQERTQLPALLAPAHQTRIHTHIYHLQSMKTTEQGRRSYKRYRHGLGKDVVLHSTPPNLTRATSFTSAVREHVLLLISMECLTILLSRRDPGNKPRHN